MGWWSFGRASGFVSKDIQWWKGICTGVRLGTLKTVAWAE